MLRSLTAKQFLELEAYKRLNPFREVRADYRAASIVQVIANVNRGRNQKAYTLQDFLLKFEGVERPPLRRQTWQEQLEVAKVIAKAFNAPGLDL